MKHILVTTFITLLALGMGCAWISPASETASEGIQVHGHWTVTVSNPDGSVDAVHEFDNAIYTAAKVMLVQMLTEGKALIPWDDPDQLWKLTLHGEDLNTDADCEEETGFAHTLVLIPSVTGDFEDSQNLRVQLAATCVVTRADNSPVITHVSTSVKYRHPSGGSATIITFSSHEFEPGKSIQVKNNQHLAFNITISFN